MIDPKRPTAAWPGSPEKLLLLRARARRRLPLFVKGDAKLPDPLSYPSGVEVLPWAAQEEHYRAFWRAIRNAIPNP